MQIEEIAINKLKPAEYNPRKIDEIALDGLQRSIEKFDCVEPIIYNKKTGNVVGGHQRLEALKKLGKKKTKVVVVDLSEKDEKALNVTLNNKHIQGEWDLEKLETVIADIKIDLDGDFEALRLDLLEINSPDINIDDFFEEDTQEKEAQKKTCPNCGVEL